MKKLVLFLAVAFSVSLFSCGHSEKAEGNDTAVVETEAVAIEEEAVPCCGDSACVDSCAAADTVCNAENA